MSDNSPTPTDTYSYDDAATDAAKASQVKLAKGLRGQAQLLAKAQERVKAHRAKLDRMVATVVSSKPGREDWYAHPGLLHREVVQEAASLSTVALHRLMQRHRRNTPRDGRRRKQAT